LLTKQYYTNYRQRLTMLMFYTVCPGFVRNRPAQFGQVLRRHAVLNVSDAVTLNGKVLQTRGAAKRTHGHQLSDDTKMV